MERIGDKQDNVELFVTVRQKNGDVAYSPFLPFCSGVVDAGSEIVPAFCKSLANHLGLFDALSIDMRALLTALFTNGRNMFDAKPERLSAT